MIKKALLFIVSLVIVAVAIVTYVLNSASFVRWAMDRYAAPQGVAYRTVTGSIWQGVRIEGLSYRHASVVQRITIRWYPSDLLRGMVHVGFFEAQGVDVDALQRLAERMDHPSTKKSGVSDRSGSSTERSLPVRIVVDRVSITTKPFHFKDISVKRCDLTAQRLRVSHDTLSLRSMGLDLHTSLGRAHLDGAIGKNLVVDRLVLEDLDIDTIRSIVETLSDNSATSNQQTPQDDAWPPFLPTHLEVIFAEASALPFTLETVTLHKVTMGLQRVLLDLQSFRIVRGKTKLSLRSDLADIDQNGSIRDDRLVNDIRLTPHQALFQRYDVPLRAEAIGAVPLHAIVDEKGADVRLALTDIRDFLETNASVPVAIRSLNTHATVRWNGWRTQADMELNASVPQVPTLIAQAAMRFDGNATRYEANATAPRIRLSDANLSALLRDMKVRIKGVDRRMDIAVANPYLTGDIRLDDNGSGTLHVQTRDKVYLKAVRALQAPLDRAWIDVRVDAPLALTKPLPLDADIVLTSNLVDLRGKVHYDKYPSGTVQVSLAKASLLPEIDPEVHWKKLLPLKVEVQEHNATATIAIKGAALHATGSADTRSGDVHGTIKLHGLKLRAVGNVRSAVRFDSDVDSFTRLRQSLGHYYDIQALPKIKGSMHLSLVVSPGGDSFAVLRSPHLSYRADRTTLYTLNDVDIVARKVGDRIVLDAYRFVLNDKVLFASKPSSAMFDGSRVALDAFWINDSLKLSGDVDLKTMQGVITAKADRFAYRDENVDLNASVDIQARLNGTTTDIEGEVGLLDTRVLYDLSAKRFPSDSDIVIVQDRLDTNQSAFMQGLSLNIRIVTKQPIVYRQGAIDLKADAELTLFKVPGDEVLLLGNITLLDDGSYRFQGKRFAIKKSTIYFTGSPSEPILDIKAQYKAMHYVVTIRVTGTPSIPNIIFSSTPHLSREQILSLILFDSIDAAEGGDANTMMKMMGGAMAKAALNDLGVSIDHLVVGSDSVEVGKKISDKTTVIYIDGDIPKVELKYEYTPHVDVIVGASERSESIDVVYKKDFSSKDIIIKRRKKKN